MRQFITTLAAGIIVGAVFSASAQSNAELLNELNALKSRISEIEGKLSQNTSTTTGVALPDATASKLEKPVHWSDIMVGGSKIKIYGFLRMDAIYDDSRPSNTQVPSFIRSENAGGVGNQSGPNNEAFNMHPRLTRLGVDLTGPEISGLWNAKASGKVEVDFYNLIGGVAESRAALRIRHAYLKLAWDDFSILAGQTSDLISQFYPSVNPDLVMWGAGNLGDRRPQLRFDYRPKLGPGNLLVQGELGFTGAVDNQNLDGNPFRDGDASGVPTVQGRLGYQIKNWDGQTIELAGWYHHGREKSDAPVGASGRQNFTSEAIGLDLKLPLYQDIVSLTGEIWSGKNLNDIRGGILQGINATTGQEINADGGWIELGVKPCKWNSWHTGYSFDNPRHKDLPIAGVGGVPAAGPTGRDLNSVWYLGTRLYFSPIEMGLDYLNWTTYYADGIGKGTDNRFQAFIAYKF